MLLPIAAFLFLSLEPNDPLPPNPPMPPELEVCILKAELCVQQDMCDPDASDVDCIEAYENCSYPIPEAHEPSCRMEYVWCKLELSALSPDWQFKRCALTYETCPS